MNTTTKPQTITFDRAMTEAQHFARNIEAIRTQVMHPDYAWNAAGEALAEKAARKVMRIQMVPCTKANVAAAVAYVSEGK